MNDKRKQILRNEQRAINKDKILYSVRDGGEAIKIRVSSIEAFLLP